MDRIQYDVGDVVKMKKKHPCGSDQWEILRTGMDFGIKCQGCGRLEDIRTVQVSLLVRAQAAAGQAAMPTAYALPRPDAWGDVHAAGGTEVNVADDHVRRRLLTTMINLRNMGL